MDNSYSGQDVLAKSTKFTKCLLILLFTSFIFFSGYVALRLKPGIAPDEVGHFEFSKLFSYTLGIPKDTETTNALGWQIAFNPFLYYWINGRLIGLLKFISSMITDNQLLIILRFSSVLYSFLNLVVFYKILVELIHNEYFRLFSLFLFSQTLMYVFLSGSVSYDNLTNLFCSLGILFFVRFLKNIKPIKNSFLLAISLTLASLTKYTVVPLILFVLILWAFTVIRKKVNFKGNERISWGLILVAVILVFANIYLYGHNLIKFRGLTPACTDVLTLKQCDVNPFTVRSKELSLEHKMSISESVAKGYPNPLEYVVYSWIPNMLYRIHGILGQESYFPSHIIIVIYLLYVWYLLLAVRYIHRLPFVFSLLALVLIGYSFVLLVMNYESELSYGFKQIAMQGRYIFPVISIFYALIGYTLEHTNSKLLRFLTVTVSILLFLYAGPLKLLTKANSLFPGWFG
jgi:hypothetical protein